MSESLEDLLDRCLEDMEKGQGVEECLQRYPQWRDELAPLLRTVARLRAAPEINPSEPFREVATIRLTNLIRGTGEKTVVTRPSSLRYKGVRWKPRWERRFAVPAILIVLLVVSSLMGGGTVYASQSALPGEALYEVKTLLESIQLLLSTSEVADAELHLEFAAERLEEAVTLVAQGRLEFVEDLMAEYAEELKASFAPLVDGVDEEEMGLLERLREALTHHQTVLASVLEEVPEEARPAIERAMNASDVGEQFLDTVGGAVTIEPPTIVPPTVVPPTIEPPTVVPPTIVPPTVVPPTVLPPTIVPPTIVPPTIVPPEETPLPPTEIPPTAIPTRVPDLPGETPGPPEEIPTPVM